MGTGVEETMPMKPEIWVRESDALPRVAQHVLLLVPRQFEEFWDIYSARILVRHEGVAPLPISDGQDWPRDYWWSVGPRSEVDRLMVTGRAWWASTETLPLPPGAVHVTSRGYNYITSAKP